MVREEKSVGNTGLNVEEVTNLIKLKLYQITASYEISSCSTKTFCCCCYCCLKFVREGSVFKSVLTLNGKILKIKVVQDTNKFQVVVQKLVCIFLRGGVTLQKFLSISKINKYATDNNEIRFAFDPRKKAAQADFKTNNQFKLLRSTCIINSTEFKHF